MEDFIEIIRREVHQMISLREFKGTVVATSYDKKKHAIKGILVPHEIETGWIPVAASHAGKDFGILVGPNVGSKEKLDGDQFEVTFDNGDPNTPSAKMKQFSAEDKPPEVESGEMLFKHQTGSQMFFDKDGQIIVTHKNGGVMKFDKDGNITHDSKDKDITVTSGKGAQTFSAKSQTFKADKIALQGEVDVAGPLNTTGNIASNGTITGLLVNSGGSGGTV